MEDASPTLSEERNENDDLEEKAGALHESVVEGESLQGVEER